MKIYFKKFIIFISLIIVFILPYFVAASPAYDNLKQIGEGENAPYQSVTPGSGTNDLAGVVGIAIQAFIGLLGVIFLSYTLYAGYNWMTAQGDEEKVTRAKDTLTRAIIGVIITIGAYAISYWVIEKLVISGKILK